MNLDLSNLTHIYTAEVATRWGDQDSYAHINNAVYFRLFEEARVQWLSELGLTVEKSDNSPVIAHTEATYYLPIEYPATVICRCYASEPGNTSLGIYHTLSTTDNPDTIYTTGYVRNVWINHQTGKPTSIPDAIRSYIQKAIKNPLTEASLEKIVSA